MLKTSPAPTAHTNGNFKHHQGLMEALSFTEEDLIANRQGRLGEAQVERLRSRSHMLLLLGLVVASLPLTFVITSLISLSSSGQLSDPGDAGALSVALGVLAIALIMAVVPLLLMVPRWWRLRRALAEGLVQAIDGTVDFDDLDQKRYTMIIVDDAGTEQRFPIGGSAYAAFEEARRYRVYVLAQARVVAAEPLDV